MCRNGVFTKMLNLKIYHTSPDAPATCMFTVTTVPMSLLHFCTCSILPSTCSYAAQSSSGNMSTYFMIENFEEQNQKSNTKAEFTLHS